MKYSEIRDRYNEVCKRLAYPDNGVVYLKLFTENDKEYYALRRANDYYFGVRQTTSNDPPILLFRVMEASTYRRIIIGNDTYFVTFTHSFQPFKAKKKK